MILTVEPKISWISFLIEGFSNPLSMMILVHRNSFPKFSTWQIWGGEPISKSMQIPEKQSKLSEITFKQSEPVRCIFKIEKRICTGIADVVVFLLIQLNPQAQNVSWPLKEPHRQQKSELRSTKHESPHRAIEAAHDKVPGRGKVRTTLLSLPEKLWHEDPEWGKTTRAPPRRSNQSNATGLLTYRDNTTQPAAFIFTMGSSRRPR